MATFLAANMGEAHRPWPDGECDGLRAAARVHREFHFKQGLLAWQDVRSGTLLIIDKNGGLNNTSTYIGFAPERKLGVVILVNRGKQHATGIGRRILHALAQDQSVPSTEGEPERDGD